MLLLLAGMASISAGLVGSAHNVARAADHLPVATPAAIPTHKVPGSEGDKTAVAMPESTSTTGPDGTFAGWEQLALRDLASVLAWPTAVTVDTSGRLQIENYHSDLDWGRAHIRVFDYTAGAQAGFAAEQEDSRLSGFSVSTDTFFSYPSYMAVQRDGNGTVIERRFRWLASPWILGIDFKGSGAASEETTRLIAEQFLSIAVWRGLPPPPSGMAPTPNPTWSLPPMPSPSASPCVVSFTDVAPGYWAYDYIQKLACDGVISGYSDGSFRPENSTTRAQLAKILILSLGWSLDNPASTSFSDVSVDHPFFSYIETAAAHGVVSGYADGTFRPDAYVTRAQVAKMLVIAMGWTMQPERRVEIRDVTPEHWAWPYVETALEHGVFSGYSDNYFRPSMAATRAQLAKVLVVSLP